MDPSRKRSVEAKEKLYMQRFEAWKQQQHAKKSRSNPARKKHVQEVKEKFKPSTVSQGNRRHSFVIPADVRNSPIPIALLPNCDDSLKNKGKVVKKLTTGKENACFQRRTHLTQRMNSSKSTVSTLCSKQLKGVSREKPIISSVPMKGAGPSEQSKAPFIRHTKTSLIRTYNQTDKKGDYLERFNKWKEERALAKKKCNVKLAVPKTNSSQMAGIQKRELISKAGTTQTKTAESHARSRRKTISSTAKSTLSSVSSEALKCRRRQTVSVTELEQKQAKTSSLKRKSLFPDECVVKKTRSVQNGSASGLQRQPQTPKRRTQSSLREELEQWLKTKGKTPSRCRHMMCYGGHSGSAEERCRSSTKPTLSVDELSQQQRVIELETAGNSITCHSDETTADSERKNMQEMENKLKVILMECLSLKDVGCPVPILLAWLDNIELDMPMAARSAAFWICRAKLIQSTGDTNRVLEVFEQAVKHEAKPSDSLAKELTDMVKEMTMTSYRYNTDDMVVNRLRTPNKQSREIQNENVFESSAIRFCVKERTPLLKRMRDIHGTDCSSPCVVVTPVRRSTRRSLATIPECLQEKDRLYKCLGDIPVSQRAMSLYQLNPTLGVDESASVTSPDSP